MIGAEKQSYFTAFILNSWKEVPNGRKSKGKSNDYQTPFLKSSESDLQEGRKEPFLRQLLSMP
jgi:hypothetical protein